MLLLLRSYVAISAICTAMTLAAWLLFAVLRWAIRVVMPELLPLYEESNWVMQAFILVIQWKLGIRLFNMMRVHVVKEALFSLPAILQPRLAAFVYYASALWLAAMVYLSWLIWSHHASTQFWMILELLTIKVGLGIVMGTALPYCAARHWLYLKNHPADSIHQPTD